MLPLASASLDVDVAVIGAGVAGLAAAATLRAAGQSVVLLEAGDRIGGRAWTNHEAALGGVAFDHGAQWLHAAHRNPLVKFAQDCGEPVHEDESLQDRLRLFAADGQPADPVSYTQAEERWNSVVKAKLGANDISLAEAAADITDDPWIATIESWEGAIIAAADADTLSLADWAANELDGANFIAPGGLGACLARCLGPPAGAVQFGARVRDITWTPQGLRIGTTLGELRAGAAIVTVSTGVLRAEAIRFTPHLIDTILAALNGLPMGLLTKIALQAAGANRLDMPEGAEIFRQLPTRFAPFLATQLWPYGTDLAVGFVGGRAAWDFCGHPEQAVAFQRDQLTTLLGPKTKSALRAEGLMTDWGSNPNFRGAYAYATPGNAGARKTLAQPQWNNQLILTGEACAPPGLAGTVAGAYLAGVEAGRKAKGFAPGPH